MAAALRAITHKRPPPRQIKRGSLYFSAPAAHHGFRLAGTLDRGTFLHVLFQLTAIIKLLAATFASELLLTYQGHRNYLLLSANCRGANEIGITITIKSAFALAAVNLVRLAGEGFLAPTLNPPVVFDLLHPCRVS